MLFIAKNFGGNYLKKKWRFLPIFLIATLFLTTTFLTINYTAKSLIKPNFDEYYVYITKVEITDDLTG
jgi:hypothetical protein